MRAISLCCAVYSILFACPDGTSALLIPTPLFLAPGPVRINFTKEAGDPPGAFFNIMAPSNGTRLAENVDLSVGFVDVKIDVLPGTYEFAAFSNETDPAFLANTEDFVVISAPATTSSATRTSSAATSTSASSTSSSTSAVAAKTSAPSSSGVVLRKSRPSTGMIVGVVVGVLALLVLLLLVFLFLRRKKQRARRRDSRGNGAFLEAPRPMMQSSLSLTSGSYPSSRVDPFITPPSSTTTLSSSAHQRQQHITNEMRLVRKQMEELRRGDDKGSSFSGPVLSASQGSTRDAGALDLERSRQQNDALQSRIVQLEAQLQSAWALGLSNDPPPGYVA
ncbi:hypothetical protein C8R44DRAFT_46137 [Mycena epipterygia]|nr:hypothetical protein C8R44DRAFT_46137 [Mycena epipterygia]